ncbi:MAG: GntR family transcriptional regulator [Chromatiales bacterium]|nr:GntR family transcriptional regulator [Chromatiales bacterium]
MATRQNDISAQALHRPRYIKVYATIRDWISQGTYRTGSQLPTESELCALFQVSRITTRKAVDLLVDEGLVTRQPGRGTFVVDDLADAPVTGDMEQLLRKVRRLSGYTTIAHPEVVEVEADAETRKDLGLPPGARVQRASHVRLLDGRPIGYVITWLPSELKVRFGLNELNESPMLTLLERKGVDILAADQVISATLADGRLAELLRTPVGAPLVHIRLVVFDSERRPVERMTAWYRGDYYHHHVRLTRSR